MTGAAECLQQSGAQNKHIFGARIEILDAELIFSTSFAEAARCSRKVRLVLFHFKQNYVPLTGEYDSPFDNFTYDEQMLPSSRDVYVTDSKRGPVCFTDT